MTPRDEMHSALQKKLETAPKGGHPKAFVAVESEEGRIFLKHLARQGLKHTSQRMEVLDEILKMDKHQSIEDITESMRRKGSRVGFSTVYRTMHVLVECGIVREQDFGTGIMRYERAYGIDHHDHLVCVECGKIIEFMNPKIEAIQDTVAKDHKFVITGHKHEIYGRCRECQ